MQIGTFPQQLQTVSLPGVSGTDGHHMSIGSFAVAGDDVKFFLFDIVEPDGPVVTQQFKGFYGIIPAQGITLFDTAGLFIPGQFVNKTFPGTKFEAFDLPVSPDDGRSRNGRPDQNGLFLCPGKDQISCPGIVSRGQSQDISRLQNRKPFFESCKRLFPASRK